MPLKQSASRKAIGENIRELKRGPQYKEAVRRHGKQVAHDQTVAIALETARKAGADIPTPKKKAQ